jgi:hypothetical protein
MPSCCHTTIRQWLDIWLYTYWQSACRRNLHTPCEQYMQANCYPSHNRFQAPQTNMQVLDIMLAGQLPISQSRPWIFFTSLMPCRRLPLHCIAADTLCRLNLVLRSLRLSSTCRRPSPSIRNCSQRQYNMSPCQLLIYHKVVSRYLPRYSHTVLGKTLPQVLFWRQATYQEHYKCQTEYECAILCERHLFVWCPQLDMT